MLFGGSADRGAGVRLLIDISDGRATNDASSGVLIGELVGIITHGVRRGKMRYCIVGAFVKRKMEKS